MLREENCALECCTASADESRETVVRQLCLEAEADAMRVERKARWVSDSLIGFVIFLSFTFLSTIMASNVVPETLSATPISIIQSLSLHLEHAHLIEEHGAD